MNKIITFLVAMAISLTAMAQVAQEREDSTRKFNPGHITSTYGYSYTYDGSGNRVGLKDSLETSLPGPIIPPILNSEPGRSESSDSTLLIEQRLRVQALIAAEARLTDSLKAQVSFRSNSTPVGSRCHHL